MIEHLHIQGFRCLKDVELRLEPLTALVGPNASGKSTILELFTPGRNIQLPDLWRKEPGRGLVIVRAGRQEIRKELAPGQTLSGLGATDVQPLRLDLNALRATIEVQRAELLSPSGDNLANVFGTFTRRQQADLAEQLCSLVPMFGDVDLVPTARPGHHTFRFHDRWKAGLTYAPREVSDGTMLLLAFLVLQYQPKVPELITIEEAERGFHPYLLGQFVDYLRKLTRGQLGQRPIQVLLATHSAELLDHLEPKEVRFLSRSDEDGSVRISEAPTESAEWEAVRDEYEKSLGGIWLSGGLGGVPG